MTNEELDSLLDSYLAETNTSRADVLLAQLHAEYDKRGLLVRDMDDPEFAYREYLTEPVMSWSRSALEVAFKARADAQLWLDINRR